MFSEGVHFQPDQPHKRGLSTGDPQRLQNQGGRDSKGKKRLRYQRDYPVIIS
jgi:hypothetical protein